MAAVVIVGGNQIGLEVIDKYRVAGILGEGGQNYILDAVDSRTQQPCAVKVLFGYGHNPEEYVNAVGRLMVARKAFREIGFHNHIVRFLGEGDSKIEAVIEGGLLKIPCYFNVYEKVDLHNESGDVPEGLSPQQSALIGAEAASALIAMHAKGWVHRDVKPKNMLIDKALHVHLGDFGIVYKLNRRTGADGKVRFIPGFPADKEYSAWEAATTVGTPHFMSPEQTDGQFVGPESDIYNLGAALYEIIAGRPPFDGNSVVEIMFNARCSIPTPLRKCRRIPKRLNNVVMKMMEKKPENRGDLRELEAELIKASTESDETQRSMWNLWRFWDKD
jgi:serine/threonine-protein kinase